MSGLLYLIPIALFLGGLGLVAFLWSLKSSQFEDLDGAANRILFDDDPKDSVPPVRTSSPSPSRAESPSEKTRKA